MTNYNVIAQSEESTVLSEYIPQGKRAEGYQSESDLERELIKLLGELGYEYLPIHSEAELISNLRKKLEELNDYTFSESEWEQFFTGCIAGKNDGIVEKTRRIQEDYVQVLHRDNGATKNITLIDKKNIYNNRLQVINQYENHDGKYENRYDVTILVNGLPLVHIELKRRGVPIREAFNQIDRYQRDSFGRRAGCMNMCRSSSSPTERIRSIILIRLDLVILKKILVQLKRNARKHQTVLSLLLSGQMAIIILLLIW